MRYTELYEDQSSIDRDEFKKLLTPGLKKLDQLYQKAGHKIRIVADQ